MTAAEQVDAKKKKMGEKEALAMLSQADHLYVAKGKKIVQLDLRTTKAAEAVALMLGPTGNLRAPTLRRGRTLIVGFDEATYGELLR